MLTPFLLLLIQFDIPVQGTLLSSVLQSRNWRLSTLRRTLTAPYYAHCVGKSAKKFGMPKITLNPNIFPQSIHASIVIKSVKVKSTLPITCHSNTEE